MDQKVFDYISSNKNLPSFLGVGQNSFHSIGKFLRTVLLQEAPVQKLKSLKLIRSISEYSPKFLGYIEKHMLNKFYEFALFNKESESPTKGLLLFASSDVINKEASSDFLILLLDSIEFWSNLTRLKTNQSYFHVVYEDLSRNGVCFIRCIPHHNEITEKINEISKEIANVHVKIFDAFDQSEIASVIKNIKQFFRSISLLCKKSSDLENKFSNDLTQVSAKVENLSNQFNALIKKVSKKAKILADPVPKKIPTTDSPVFIEDLEFSFDETDPGHEEEWQDIKNEFFRLKDAEITYLAQIKLYQQEYFKLKNKFESFFQDAKTAKEKNKKRKNDLKEEIVKLRTENEKVNEEKNKLHVIVSGMEQNKVQMKEIFDEISIENSKLKRIIDELKTELSELKMNDTSRVFDKRFSLTTDSFFQQNYFEFDNDSFFYNLLTVTQGILYKNRYVQVGISLKLEKKSGIALIYIGNCRNKPITTLETNIESTEMIIEINKVQENAPIPMGQQADRIIHFQVKNPFKNSPNLVLRYNNSVKVLRLPITYALFLTAVERTDIEEIWQAFEKIEQLKKILDLEDGGIGEINNIEKKELNYKTMKASSEDLANYICFAPYFKVYKANAFFLVYCKEIMIQVRDSEIGIRVEIRSYFKEAFEIIAEMVDSQIKNVISKQ